MPPGFSTSHYSQYNSPPAASALVSPRSLLEMQNFDFKIQKSNDLKTEIFIVSLSELESNQILIRYQALPPVL